MYNILIVDDDLDLLEGQSLYLRAKGYHVTTAASMVDGLAVLDSFTPDLVIADLMMEHYDSGFVFCNKLKHYEGLENVPILMQTAASRETGFILDAADSNTKKWVNVEVIMAKPVPLPDLEEKIERYLKHE